MSESTPPKRNVFSDMVPDENYHGLAHVLGVTNVRDFEQRYGKEHPLYADAVDFFRVHAKRDEHG